MDRRVIEGDESMDLGVDNDGNDDEEEEHNQALEAAAAEEVGAMIMAAIRDRLRDDEVEEHNQAVEAAVARPMFRAEVQDRVRGQQAADERLEEQRILRERLARNAARVLAIPRRAGSRVERARAAAHGAAGLPLPPDAPAEAPPNEEPSLLEQLISRIHIFLSGEDEVVIDEEQARSVLEASAGDIDIAASLYCDHYFATIASRRNARRSAEDNEEASPRRVRRRLEERLEEPVADNDEDIEEGEEEPGPEEPDVPPNMPPPDLPFRIVARAQPQDHAEGAPVSDDEGPQRPSHRSRRRAISRRRYYEARNIVDNAIIPAPPLRNISNSVEQPSEEAVESRRNQASAKNEDKNDIDDEDFLRDFIIDDDWIFHEDDTAPPLRPPVSVLWGAPSPPSQSSRGNDDNDPPEAGGGANNLHNNVIAEDEDGDDAALSPRPGICHTWLRSGFTSSTCCTGLVTKPHPDEEVLLSRWSQIVGSRKITPPPYHCRGLTALLSVVTALIYSGASIQGPTVNCNAARQPFAELSESERKREFDSRLVDALSSLLFIAAQASVDRKKRALAKNPRLMLPPDAGDGDKRRQQSLRRKLRLCPTCRWLDDIGTGDGRIPEGQTVQITSSYTSIEDIRSYVVSTLRSFTNRGGCALFLETIIRIHGKSCVERMLRCARRKASMPEKKALIECVCEQKKLQQMSAPSDGASNQWTAEPLDHSCASIELISLLLTGEVHSTFQGWSTAGLGIGILSNKQGEVGRQLMRPEKPVWVLRGDTCYSVVWLDGSKEESKNIARTDRPGTVFRLSHWHCWFGDRHINKSGMRVITARGEWTPPVSSTAEADSSNKKTVTEQILARRRERSHVVSSDEQGEDDEATSESHITKEEIDRVKVHPDDEKYYPKNYRQWRFDMGKANPDKVDMDMKMGPVGVDREHWTPYFRLNNRQRMVVEMKVSPKINRILWTRWPGATIDRFTPDGEEPPIV